MDRIADLVFPTGPASRWVWSAHPHLHGRDYMSATKRLLDDLLQAWDNGDDEARKQLAELGWEEAFSRSYRPALQYRRLGLSVVPVIPETKKTFIKWGPFRRRLPSEAELREWFLEEWPDASVAVVVGLTSNLLVVDVDGKAAHDELLRRVGKLPHTPKAMSGKGSRHRYHLFFTHPNVKTKAKFTPWHNSLEFRGEGGIVVLPPSSHASGNQYKWATGLSIFNTTLAEVPDAIHQALIKASKRTPIIRSASQVDPKVKLVPSLSQATQEFLRGKCINGPSWNHRLFAAACDMRGNDIPLEDAMPSLLRGAGPYDESEKAKAVVTIRSAYSQPRQPARSTSHNSNLIVLKPNAPQKNK